MRSSCVSCPSGSARLGSDWFVGKPRNIQRPRTSHNYIRSSRARSRSSLPRTRWLPYRPSAAGRAAASPALLEVLL
eukprot:8538035-Pyramimonas_sp.AAC.1